MTHHNDPRPRAKSTPKDLTLQTFTRRQFLTYQTIVEGGVPWWTANEAVSTTALEHPEWDMDEEMTWGQWQQRMTK